MGSFSSQSAALPKSEHTREPNDSSYKSQNHSSSLTEYRIPGYLVNPQHLVKVLQERFNGNYKVKLRNDNYFISTPARLTKSELISC
ncbi:hypothetical protein F5Y11DRAFT_337333, partial [Daldinia sp. FL1419]